MTEKTTPTVIETHAGRTIALDLEDGRFYLLRDDGTIRAGDRGQPTLERARTEASGRAAAKARKAPRYRAALVDGHRGVVWTGEWRGFSFAKGHVGEAAFRTIDSSGSGSMRYYRDAYLIPICDGAAVTELRGIESEERRLRAELHKLRKSRSALLEKRGARVQTVFAHGTRDLESARAVEEQSTLERLAELVQADRERKAAPLS